MTTVTVPVARRAAARRSLWWLVAAGAGLAVLGVVLAVLLLVRPDLVRVGGGPASVGEAVPTAFGTFTVTNAATTFVPDTQGPPSQHSGTRGSDQIQVWVRFANTRWDRGLAYSPSQLRLVGGAGAAPRRPDGSTLEDAVLPRGASIDGQVWFDLAKGQRVSPSQQLEYGGPGGSRVRVAIGPAVAPTPSAPTSPTDHGH